jgi:hypothetical protein
MPGAMTGVLGRDQLLNSQSFRGGKFYSISDSRVRVLYRTLSESSIATQDRNGQSKKDWEVGTYYGGCTGLHAYGSRPGLDQIFARTDPHMSGFSGYMALRYKSSLVVRLVWVVAMHFLLGTLSRSNTSPEGM